MPRRDCPSVSAETPNRTVKVIEEAVASLFPSGADDGIIFEEPFFDRAFMYDLGLISPGVVDLSGV